MAAVAAAGSQVAALRGNQREAASVKRRHQSSVFFNCFSQKSKTTSSECGNPVNEIFSIEMETQPVGVFHCPTLYQDALPLSGLFWLHKLRNIVVFEVLAARFG